ncbi:MAG: glycine cleavage system protein GcvH [Oligoflexales bacterium]
MNLPTELHYTKDHEWVSATSGEVMIGVSAFAIEQLGDIVHVDLPSVGDELVAGDPFGSIESTKTVSDLYSPGNGIVTAVHDSILENPEKLQEDAYHEGWLVKIKLSESIDGAMSSTDYEAYLQDS